MFGLNAAGAPEIKLKAQLVWATDEAKPNDPNLKDLETKLIDKLKRFLRWKNYFEVNKKTFSLPASGSVTLIMSSKCTVEIKKIEGDNMEVKLVGKGKWVKTVKRPIKPLLQGEYSIIGGDDKEKYEDAWLVVFSAAGP